MKVERTKEHAWLERLVGEWSVSSEVVMGPDKPAEKLTGRETVRSLGGLWVVCEGHGEMPGGGTAHTIMTLGYDPVRARVVGTFIASMMTHLWTYEGSLDARGQVLTLESEGPDCVEEGKVTRYRDVIELEDETHRVLTSSMLGPEGGWHQFMRASYRRGG